jgi:hypothetical protein
VTGVQTCALPIFSSSKSLVITIMLVFFVIFNYFTGLMSHYFFREEKEHITKAVQGAFFYSFKKVHYLLLWHVLLFIILAVLLALAYLINLGIRPLLVIFAFLIYFALARIVMSKVFEKHLGKRTGKQLNQG